MVKHTRTSPRRAERLEKRVCISITHLLSIKLGLRVDTSRANPLPISKGEVIAFLRERAEQPAESAQGYEPNASPLSPLTE